MKAHLKRGVYGWGFFMLSPTRHDPRSHIATSAGQYIDVLVRLDILLDVGYLNMG